jgi:hypothetical protein
MKDGKPARRRAATAAKPSAEDATASAQLPKRKLPKQAVVVIHGMGEQDPMTTIRTFVEAVWTRDEALTDAYRKRGAARADGEPTNATWIVPDARTGSHELYRITTTYDLQDRRTDFYEIYWADLVQDTSRGRLFAWMKELLWRRWKDVPADAFKLYWATWAFAIIIVAASLYTAGLLWSDWPNPSGALVLAAAASVVFWALDRYVIPYFGDVAAYVQPKPQTLKNRADVRERGLNLLRSLSDDDEYDRIVLVGHSLGSVIAYDLLSILWSERCPRNLTVSDDKAILAAIRRVEKYALLPGGLPGEMEDASRLALRKAQWSLYALLRKRSGKTEKPWKISDFVTLGSPLTHAEFLAVHNVEHLYDRVRDRLLPVCPPLSESAKEQRLLYYRAPKVRAMHHAAPYAATRWTNIFDIGNLITTGDPFSGALGENFGPGVEEHQVRLRHPRWGRIFTHTQYWSLESTGQEVMPDGTEGPRSHLDVLRSAIDLRRVQESGSAESDPPA